MPDDVTAGSDTGIDAPTHLAQLHLRVEMLVLMETSILLLFLQRRGCVQPHPESHDNFVVNFICNSHVGALKKKGKRKIIKPSYIEKNFYNLIFLKIEEERFRFSTLLRSEFVSPGFILFRVRLLYIQLK